MLNAGMELILKKVVSSSETADAVASGALKVFSTPMMIAFMESTAFELAQKNLEEGDTTVGTAVNIKHLKAWHMSTFLAKFLSWRYCTMDLLEIIGIFIKKEVHHEAQGEI